MSIIKTINGWLLLPSSRRRQWFIFLKARLITWLVHKRQLKICGKRSFIQCPLFWTPEFIEIGRHVTAWSGSRFEGIDRHGNQRFSPSLIVGDRVSFQQNCHVTFAGRLEIGAETAILCGVLITDIDHEYSDHNIPVLDQPIFIKKTKIGKKCLIGAGAKILAGTVLGDNCIVGANAVVRGVFPDDCVLIGMPARIIKRRDPGTGMWQKVVPKGLFRN